MKITLHDKRTFDNPTDADVEALFASLSDAGDFIVLTDDDLGEVRAAGPQDGKFLLQCDLQRDGQIFAGERQDVGAPEATGIFREFLSRGTQWSSHFVSREAPPFRIAGVVLLVFGLLVAAGLLYILGAA